MVRSNENGLNVISRQNAPAVGGKVTAPTEQSRRPLRDINRNIITASSHPSAVQKRPQEPNKDDMLRKNALLLPNRPITRKFAAQMSIMQQEVKKEEKSALSPDEPEDCELLDDEVLNKDPDSVNLPSVVQHTEAVRDEIDQMNEEVEMEDVADDLILDIDTPDKNNPLAAVEYVDDMHTYYKIVEVAGCAPPNYMDSQHDINRRMRAILIDWLIEVHYKFDLMDETLYLTVNLIDRFLARQQVGRKKLQLVGVTAMLLASKYEEVSVPVVEDFILITDKAYTREEVLQMEWQMVNTLQFNLSAPTPYMFMRRFLKAAQSNKKLELLSFFMIELCLVEYESLKYPPSVLSAAAIFTAQCTLCGYKQWNITCEWHSGYSQDQLLECARMMVSCHMNAGNGRLTGVHRKYNTSKYGYTARSEPALFLFETTPPPGF